MYHMDADYVYGEKAWRQVDENAASYIERPGGNTLQNASCTSLYHPPQKPSKLDESDMRDTAGEVRTSS